MEIVILAFLTACGFIILWIKALGIQKAMRWQVLGDILITGLLLFIGIGTFSGVAMACIAGLVVSVGLAGINFFYKGSWT